MRKFNKALNTDITELKTLHMKKDKTEFRKRKAEVMQKHNISKATIYREMNKDMPGSYQQPKYSNKAQEITEKEKEMVKTLMFKKIPFVHICNEMTRLKNENYSWDRFDRIRKEIEKDMKAEVNAKKVYEPIIIGEITGEVIPLKKESAWGGDLKLTLEAIVNMDKMDKDSYVPLIIKGREIKITEEIRRDMNAKLANAADADGKPIMDSIDSDTKHLLKEQLQNMKNGMKYSVRDLYDIRKMYKEMGGVNTFQPIDFDLLVAVVQHFKPDATLDEIENVTSDLAEKFPECSIYIKPDELKMRKKVQKAMRERM